MLAHLLTSASSYSQASWRATDGEFSTGQQWRGHTDLPLSVPSALPPSLQTQARTQQPVTWSQVQMLAWQPT